MYYLVYVSEVKSFAQKFSSFPSPEKGSLVELSGEALSLGFQRGDIVFHTGSNMAGG